MNELLTSRTDMVFIRPGFASSAARCFFHPYFILVLVFIASRLGYYICGVRFDDRGLEGYLQFVDVDLLQHHLLQSLFYLHIQPPGYNLFLGIILKLFPDTYSAAFHIIHCVFGLCITISLFNLMKYLGTETKSAIIITLLFIISPGVILFENFILYEYQMLFLLTISAVFLVCFIQRRRSVYVVLFMVCQFWIVMIRNQYHVIYFIAVFLLLLLLIKHHRKQVAVIGSILTAIILALYLKNQILFGRFTLSSWLELNLVQVMSAQLTREERQQLVSQGYISPLTGNYYFDLQPPVIGVPVSYVRKYVKIPPETNIPVLDREMKSLGSTVNYNHRGFIEAGKYYKKDAFSLLLHAPKAYLRSLAIAWFTYFLPSGDFIFFDLNLPRIQKIDRFFNIVLSGQFKHAPDRATLRRLNNQGAGLSLLLYTGIYQLVGFPVLFIFGIWFLYRGVRKRSLNDSQALLLYFLLINIAYCTATANFLSSYENNRYRFPLDGFYVVLAALAFEQCRRKIKSYLGRKEQ